MARVVVLDAGPLMLISKPRGLAPADRCRAWIHALDAAGARVEVPEIADDEVRRELLLVGAPAALKRLDLMESGLGYLELTTPAMRRAAELWALVRRGGVPTADPRALDADCILAAQASLLGGPGDMVTLATTNVRHLGRFPGIDAHPWETIALDGLGRPGAAAARGRPLPGP